MKWPWVSRARYELLEHNFEQLRALAHDQGNRAYQYQEGLHERLRDAKNQLDALLERYHDLATRQPHVATAESITLPEPDVPPPQVLAAMRRISPSDDAAFRANWAYWEKNKQTASDHPDAFADEILKGEEHD